MKKTASPLKKSYEQLQKEISKNTGKRLAEVSFLPIANIKEMTEVFQPRSKDGNVYAEEDMHDVLVKALKHRKGEPLEAIIVWWSGMHFYVIDGHHRLAAYREVGGKWLEGTGIPVNEFRGTLEEAHRESISNNSKAKLNMLLSDKANAAWKLTCTSAASKMEVALASDVSESLVATMRQRLRDLREHTQVDNFVTDEPCWWSYQDMDDMELAGFTWQEVKRIFKPAPPKEWDDATTVEQAEIFKGKLLRHFGKEIHKQPEAFAMALRLINRTLPKRLMTTYEWSDIIQELVEAELEMGTEE